MDQLVNEINHQWKNCNLQQQLINTVDKSWLPFFKKTGLYEKLLEINFKINNEIETYGSSMAILPRPENVFRTFSIPIDKVKVVILGQDVYPNIRKCTNNKEIFKEEATGLAFSVPQILGFLLLYEIFLKK